MRNVKDRNAFFLSGPRDAKQVVDLRLGQRRCRLVEYEYARLGRDALGNLDELLLRK